MKQTAIEYLVEQLIPKALTAEQYYHIEQALELEKQQIIDAVNSQRKLGWDEKGEQYYNKTYKYK